MSRRRWTLRSRRNWLPMSPGARAKAEWPPTSKPAATPAVGRQNPAPPDCGGVVAAGVVAAPGVVTDDGVLLIAGLALDPHADAVTPKIATQANGATHRAT